MNRARAKQPKGWSQNQITDSPFSGYVEPIVKIVDCKTRKYFSTDKSSLLVKAAETEVLITFYRIKYANPDRKNKAEENYQRALETLKLAKKGLISSVPSFKITDTENV